MLGKTAELQVLVGDAEAAARTYARLSEVLQRDGYREAAAAAAAQARALLPPAPPPPVAATPPADTAALAPPAEWPVAKITW